MSDADAVAEARAYNEEVERLLATQPSVHEVPPEVSRRIRREGQGIFPATVLLPQARDLSVPGRSGEIALRVLAPEREATGIYVHIHGGGWVLGSADGQDERLWAIAEETGLCAVSIEYRLAPEHPYPAAPDDCEDAVLWLLEHGPRELDTPDVLTIGGESAGAQLAAVTLLRLRDRHGVTPFRAANLVYGVFDLSMTPSQRNWGERNLVLSTPIMHWFGDCFVPDVERDHRRDPDVSPLYADLSGLPPALFTIGDADPLLDDSLFMAARWQAAGSPAELVVYPEAAHGFTLFPIEVGRRCNADQHAFLRSSCR